MNRLIRMTVAPIAAVMLLMCANLRADVLSQVPGEALFFVKVTNLKDTSDKFARLANDLGVAAMVQQLQDPLGTLQMQMGINEGLNVNGDLAFVFIDPSAVPDGSGPDESMVMLIPVSDYNAFLNNNNFTEITADGDITSFNMPMTGQTTYSAKWGNYAAIAPARAVLSVRPSGVKVSGVASKELQKDIVFFANLPKLKTVLQPALADGRETILSEMEQGLANEPEAAKFAPVLMAAVNRLLDVADSFLRDANAATVALSFVPDGVNASVVAEFEQGSYLGNFVSSSKNTTESFTRGLPAGKYMFFGGTTADAAQTEKLLNDLANPILDELRKIGGEQADAIDRMYGHLLAYVRSAEAQAFGVMAPQGEVGDTALLQGVSVYRGDANAMKTAYLEMSKGQQDLMTAFGMPADQFSYNITPAGKTVDGVAFDIVVSEMKFDPSDPAAAQAEQMMKFLYGPEGMKFLVAAVDNKTLLQTFGLDDAAISAAIKSIRAGDDPLASYPGLGEVNAQLPSSRVGAFYVPVDEVVTAGLNVARQFGLGVNVQMQPELPPLGVAVATEGTALRIDGHAPTQLISQLIAAGFQVGMQMQGGPGGGPRRGPGGL